MEREKTGQGKIKALFLEVYGFPVEWSQMVVKDRIGPPEMIEYHTSLMKGLGLENERDRHTENDR